MICDYCGQEMGYECQVVGVVRRIKASCPDCEGSFAVDHDPGFVRPSDAVLRALWQPNATWRRDGGYGPKAGERCLVYDNNGTMAVESWSEDGHLRVTVGVLDSDYALDPEVVMA